MLGGGWHHRPPGGRAKFASRVGIVAVAEDDVRRSLQKLGKEGYLAAAAAMKAKAEQILKAARPLAPDDPETQGLLAESGHVSQTRASTTAQRITVSVVFGGKLLEQRLGDRAYSAWALVQHEDVTLKHQRGQAKFVEIPFLRIAPSVPEAVRAALPTEAP